MKILIVGSFCFEMYAPAFYNAWIDMGYDVEKIDYDEYHFHHHNPAATFFNRFQNRYHFGFFMRCYNHDIISKVKDFQPDFVFLYRCYNIYGTTIKTIREKTIVFSYNNDDPFSGVPSSSFYRYHADDARFCHLNYVYRSKNIEDYSKRGILATKVLLPYFRKASNFPIEVEKDIPIAFLGHFEDDGRDSLIYELKREGLPIIVFGDENWLNAPLYNSIKDVVYPAKRGSEYNETINRVRINLVFFSKINHDTYTRRCFEIPAAKGVMLSEFTDDMESLFPENNCAVYFRSSKDLVEKAKWLMNNQEIAKRIAENAYQRVLEIGGSEYDRCQQIIDDYSMISEKEVKQFR